MYRLKVGLAEKKRLLTRLRVRDPMEFHCDCHSSSCHSNDWGRMSEAEEIEREEKWLERKAM